MVHPEDLRAVRDALDATRFSEEPATASARVAHAGGRWVWMRITAQSGDDTKLIAIFADITQEKDADRRKTEAETRLQEAIVNAPQGAALWDRDAALVIANPRYAELIGYKGGTLPRGMTYDAVMRGTLSEGEDLTDAGLPPHWAVQKLESVADGTDELLTIGETWVHAAHRLTSDGGLLTVMTDITAVRAQEEELVRSQSELTSAIVALERHQTLLEEQASELTTLTARLEMEKQRAEEASRAKTEFLANMSHELRTPLNAIIGFSEIMRAELFGPLGHAKYREYARDVVQSGQGLLELISDILDMSKIESGELVLAPEPVSPSEIAGEIMRIVEPRAAERNVRLLRDIEADITVTADRRALKRTLLNLLSNAIRFNVDGGAARLRIKKVSGAVVFAIEDTGIGIAPQDIPKLGKPFVQLDREGSDARGTGLGLAVAKALVDMHGGGLAIESAPGKGTIVRFSIPMAMAEAEPEKADA
jgi:two-component system cell cycle sensor histidine kinase PleC